VFQIKLLTSGHGDVCETLEQYCVSDIGEETAFVCESTDGSVEGIAAVGLCGIITRAKEEALMRELAGKAPLPPLPEAAGPEERFARIDRLLETAMAGANVFGRIPDLDRLLDIKILSVDPHYRGKRVAIGICDKIRLVQGDENLFTSHTCFDTDI